MKLFKFLQEDGDTHIIAALNEKEAEVGFLESTSVPMDGVKISEIPKSEWDTIVVDFEEPEPNTDDENYSERYPNGHDKTEYKGGYLICGRYTDLVNHAGEQTSVIASNAWE